MARAAKAAWLSGISKQRTSGKQQGRENCWDESAGKIVDFPSGAVVKNLPANARLQKI